MFEFYHASVTASGRSGGGQTVSVSGLVRDEVRVSRTIAATVLDQSVPENVGRFDLAFPSGLYPGDQPAADITTQVAIAVVYLCRTIGAQTLTTRTLVVFRRGKP